MSSRASQYHSLECLTNRRNRKGVASAVETSYSGYDKKTGEPVRAPLSFSCWRIETCDYLMNSISW